MADAGIKIKTSSRDYRPSVSQEGFEVKMLKPRNIVEMLHVGSRDIGFTGADWVAEMGVNLVELIDTGLDTVKMVAAAPADLLVEGNLPDRHLVVAAEYERLTRAWIKKQGIDATLVSSYGATEVFPPEDADFIIDLVASGATLRANKLLVFDTLMASSTKLYASSAAYENPAKRDLIDELVLLLRSVLEARLRVMVEINVPADKLDAVIEVLPCMKDPTLSRLHGEAGYAVRAAVPREQLPQIIPEIKRRGGTDVVVTNLAQIMP